MSLVFNMVGGGGSGSLKDTDAILTVTVQTGSTVTMTKGALSLTPTMWVQAADNTLDCALFVIAPSLFDAQNAWTVTATLGTDTASDTVTIDSNEQYDLLLTFFPAGYTALNYLESSGTQYVTMYFAENKSLDYLRVVADITLLTAEKIAFGADNWYRIVPGSGNVYPLGNPNSSPRGNDIKSRMLGKRVIYESTSNNEIIIKVDGNIVFTGSFQTQNRNYMRIFISVPSFGGAKLRVYSFKVYDTDHTTLLYDLVPAMRTSDNEVGLINLVDRVTFLTNNGTGTFAYG